MAATVTPNRLQADSPPAADQVLEKAERHIVGLVWSRLGQQDRAPATEGKQHLSMALVRLNKLWETIELYPSILRGQTLGARHRDVHSLVETFSSCHPYSAEVFLPTRGALCRTFLLAKLNFCRLLGLVVTELLPDDPAEPHLRTLVERVQTSAACNIMAEDLLRMIAADNSLSGDFRRRATLVLLQMWEYRACQVVPRFFPVLDSVWQAKAHVTVSYGTLSGASELLTMLREGCDPLFVECFSQDDVSDDEEYALQELVLNFSYEQIQQIQQYMETSGQTSVSALQVATILGIPVQQLQVQTCTCEQMLYTFRERQSLAAHRLACGRPGPKRTAEQYLMTYLIERFSDEELNGCEES